MHTTDQPSITTSPEPPRAAPDPAGLPAALVFFLSASERGAVLNALRRIDRDRDRALLRALGVHPHTD